MIDLILIGQVGLLVLVELGVLLWLYKYKIAKINFDKWEQKITENQSSLLLSLLEPVILEIETRLKEAIPQSVMEVVKGQLLASTGQLSRAGGGIPETEAEIGLSIAEQVLKMCGLKAPPPLLTARLAAGLANLVKSKDGAAIAPIGTPINLSFEPRL